MIKRLLLVLGLPAVLFLTWYAASANSENFYAPPARKITSGVHG